MPEQTHTPPEWTAEDNRNTAGHGYIGIRAAEGRLIGVVLPSGPNPDADARLIAAAPHLANAALLALSYLKGKGIVPNPVASSLAWSLQQAGVIDEATAAAWSQGEGRPDDA